MPYYLRAIKIAKWRRHAGVAWLADNEIQADALGDLKTETNALSVWEVDDDRSNLGRVLTAVAANRDHLSDLSYVLLTKDDLRAIGAKIASSEGGTVDREVNKWHRDIVELTTQKLHQIAVVVNDKPEKPRRLPGDVAGLLRQGIAEGRFSAAQLEEGLRKEIERRG